MCYPSLAHQLIHTSEICIVLGFCQQTYGMNEVLFTMLEEVWICVQGRIIVLQVRDRRLHQVCDKELRGAVWNVNAFQVQPLATAAASRSIVQICCHTLNHSSRCLSPLRAVVQQTISSASTSNQPPAFVHPQLICTAVSHLANASQLILLAGKILLAIVCNRLQSGCGGLQGKLLAGVHSRVQLFRWAARGEGHELQLECSHSGHIMVLYIAVRGDFILVGARLL